jgi:hypothetical protein
MNEESVIALVEEYQDWSDEELVRTYSENDRDQYGEVAFEAMRRVLTGRKVSIPSQQDHTPRPKKEKPKHKVWFRLWVVLSGLWVFYNFLLVLYGMGLDTFMLFGLLPPIVVYVLGRAVYWIYKRFIEPEEDGK